MLLRTKLIWLFILIPCALLRAQGNDTPKIKFQNQIELGFNYALFFGNRSELSGLGNAYHNSNTYQQWYLYENFKYFWRDNTYRSYKAIINEKHLIKFSYEAYASNYINAGLYQTGIIAGGFEMKSLGYGYIIPFKKFRISLVGEISQRKGGELISFGYDGFHDYLAHLDYNSYGVGLGVECEYFFTKNFSIGSNIYYFNFPFEDARPYGDDVQYVDKSIVDAYKPITDFFNINFRLAYKFSFPKFKK